MVSLHSKETTTLLDIHVSPQQMFHEHHIRAKHRVDCYRPWDANKETLHCVQDAVL